MKTIIISLYTQQPLLATSFQGDPNSDVSYSYIPGSMIRGAIIGRYMKKHHLSELDLTNEEVKRLFFNANSTRYLNAYLLSQEGERTLPVPRSWFKDKDAELTENSEILVYDFSIEKDEDLENPKGVGEFFWTKESHYIRFYQEKRRINIHNQRDRKKGRSTQIKRDVTTNQLKGEGEIFRYEAIDAGQTFQAAILCSNEADVETLKDLLQISQDLWLGGSQSAGYGHTKIKINNPDDWNEINIPADERIDRDNLTITLLSDLILRDEYGQYAVIPTSAQHQTLSPLTKELEKILDVTLNPKLSYASSTLVGGFNRKWGLPLPQVPVLAAGSVFVFDNISLTEEQIKQLELRGIGERRVEGFGRIAVNWLEEQSFSVKKPSAIANFNQPPLKQDASRSLAALMAERLLQEKLEKALQKYIGRINIQGDISNSQLTRLELVARQALSTGDCEIVRSLLNNLPANARGQFERATINTHSLKQKLDEWLQNPKCWISNQQDLTVTVADVERTLTDEIAKANKLAEKYTLRLIMALAKKATKEKE